MSIGAKGSSVRGYTVSALVREAGRRLGSVAEARWIVAHVTGLPVGDLVTRGGEAVDGAEADALQALVERCRTGEPIQYVLGTWAFRRLELAVDPRVLIPRPETEVLVEVALEELRAHAEPMETGSALVAVDLGTGSGAIALSIAAEFDASTPLTVWATDASKDALTVARHNIEHVAAKHPDAAGRVRLARGDWWAALPHALVGAAAVIVSNPPYVSEAEWSGLDRRVRDHEPKGALVPGPSGLEAVALLLRGRRAGSSRAGAWCSRWRRGSCPPPPPSQAPSATNTSRPAPTWPAAPASSWRGRRRDGHDRVITRLRLWSRSRAGMGRPAARRGGGHPHRHRLRAGRRTRPGRRHRRAFRSEGPSSIARPPGVGGGRGTGEPVGGGGTAGAGAASGGGVLAGGLTIVVRRSPRLSWDIGPHADTIGLRIPDHAVARALCAEAGPLAVSSANLHGEAPCTEASAVSSVFGAGIVVVDCGRCAGVPSTVVAVDEGAPRCLRHGAVPWADVLRVATA